MRNRVGKSPGYLISGLLAILPTFAISYSAFGLSADGGKMVMWLAVLIAFAMVINKALKIDEKRQRIAAFVLGSIFSICTVFGRSIRKFEGLAEYTSLTGIAVFIFTLAGFIIIYSALLLCLFDFVLKKNFHQSPPEGPRFFKDNRRSLLTIWAIIVACWLPYFVLCFPGILTYDSYNQLSQVLGKSDLSSHHPIIHTALLKIFMSIGAVFGSDILGIAFYSGTQMLIMSGVFSFALWYLARVGVHKKIRLLLLLYFALFPVNALYSITVWKDVLFGGIALTLFILIFQCIRNPDSIFKYKSRMVIIGILIALFCLFRNNGLYAFILFAPFFAVACRRFWKQILCLFIGCAVVVSGFNFVVFDVIHAGKGSVAESLSVPLQQIARTVKYHKDELSQDELDTINEILPVDELPELYVSVISDNVKNRLNDKAFSENKTRYISLWAGLFFKYPKEYINSFLCGTYGYWYPDIIYWTAAEGDYRDDTVVDVQHSTAAKSFISVMNSYILPGVPGVSMLYSIGFMMWMVLIAAGIFILKRQKKFLIPVILLLAIWLTVIASPVFCEYRYIYSVILTSPVYLALAASIPVRKKEIEEAAD